MDKIFKPNFNTFSYFLLSFFIYIGLIVGIFAKLTYFQDQSKRYTDTKDAFMDITIVEREIDEVTKAPEKKEEIVESKEPFKKPKEVEEEVKIETTNKPVEPEAKAEPNLKDLFNDINISKLKDDKVEKKAETKVQSRLKPEKKESGKESKAASDIISSLQLDKSAKTKKSEISGEYDEYKGRITRILKERWSVYKANSNDSAKVEIMISVNGNFSYNIKQLSYNSEFNDKVREFLQKMTFEKFPVSKDGKSFTQIFDFKDEIN